MKYLLVVFAGFLLLSCSNSETPDIEESDEITEGIGFKFEDSFETTTNEFTELFPEDGSRWTNVQLVHPNNATNVIALSSEVSSNGNQSLLIESKKSDAILSKADIEKSGFQAGVNSKVTIKADFFLDSDANLENLLLIDLECCSCWDPNVPENQCPGIRLMMSAGNDYLSIERGKIAGDLLLQTTTSFPRKEWVNVKWVLSLSPNEDGTNELFINGNQVLSENGMNMPNAEIFKNLFAEENIDFELQEPVVYERVQIGATANPDADDLRLFVDNFSLEVLSN